MGYEAGTPDANEKDTEVAQQERRPALSGDATTRSVSIGGETPEYSVIITGDRNVVYLWAVLTIPLIPFFNSFMSKAGEDAYLAIKRWTRRRLEMRQKDRLILEDSDTHIRLELTAKCSVLEVHGCKFRL